MALAFIDHRLGNDEETLKEYVTWTDSHTSYENYFCLYLLLLDLEQEDSALAVLRKAAKNLAKINEDYHVKYFFIEPHFHPAYAVEYAYQHEKAKEVVEGNVGMIFEDQLLEAINDGNTAYRLPEQYYGYDQIRLFMRFYE